MGRTMLAAVISAIALWLASPAVGIGPIAWVALVPASYVLFSAPGGSVTRLVIPLTFGLYLELLLIGALPFGVAEGQWGEPIAPVMIGDSPVLAVALGAIPMLGLLLYWLRFGTPWGLDRLPGPAGTVAAVAVPALAWTALDFARVKLDPAGFWGPLFLSQAESEGAAPAAIAGPMFLTFAIVAFSYAVGLLLARASAAERPSRTLARGGLTVAALAAAYLALAAAAPRPPDGEPVTVAAVQPGYDTAEEDRPQLRRWEPGKYGLAALDLIGDLDGPTRQAAAAGADLVVWPEATFYVDPRGYPSVMEELRDLARATGAAITVPFFDRGPDNSASFVLLPDGRLSDTQAKRRPMWFLGEGAPDVGEARVAEVGPLRIAGLLGVDSQDPEIARDAVAQGATLITTSTHDWDQLAEPHQAATALAARATGVPIVRADWRYGSAVYDAGGGRVADAGDELRRSVLVAEVTPGKSTPYARLGDVFGWLALAATAAAGVAGVARRDRRRRRQGGSEPLSARQPA
jgi:apolipoprotein N-acyltransferase